MREIKFRGKSIMSDWLYGSLIFDERGKPCIVGVVVELCNEYVSLEHWQLVDEKSIGQFTGLKDKNGKEIWEGDILHWDGNPVEEYTKGKVHFVSGSFLIRFLPDGQDEILADQLDQEDWEVIGNIYENHELLEGEESK